MMSHTKRVTDDMLYAVGSMTAETSCTFKDPLHDVSYPSCGPQHEGPLHEVCDLS